MKRRSSSILLFAVLTSVAAKGTQDLSFGVDAQTVGRVGSVLAEENSAYGAFQNPATLAAVPKTRLSVSTAQQTSTWAPFNHVVTQVARVDGARITLRDNYQVPEERGLVWSFGLAQPITLPFWKSRPIGVGISASGPFESLRRFVAGAPSDFRALRYGVSDTQFKGAFGASVEVMPRWLWLGLGLSLYMTGAGDADATLIASDPTARIALDVALNSSVVAGLYARGDLDRVGFVFRQAMDPSFSQRFLGRVQVGDTDIASQPIQVDTSLYYEPASLEIDWQHRFSWAVVSAGASFQNWRGYRSSHLDLQATDNLGAIRRTRAPELAMRDTLSPRLSFERQWPGETLTTAIGYRYRPTPMADLSSSSNLFDTDAHVVGVGVTYRPRWEFLAPWRTTWGIFTQVHFLVPRDVAKRDALAFGGPSYRIEGTAHTFGLSLQIEI